MKNLDKQTALRQAGLCCNFMWQDEAAEGQYDGVPSADSGFLIGTLPEKVNGSDVFVIHIEGSAESEFGYSYPVERDVKVWLQESGEPIVGDATEEDVAQAEQHEKDKSCKEYADLMAIVQRGAYEEGDNGEYWYPDQKNGTDISARLHKLDCTALDAGLHFGLRDGKYILEPATQEELDAYEQAKEEEEEE